jgi:hypothetical protein
MPWVDLGSTQPVTASSDTTGLNLGNLTTYLNLATYYARVGQFSI